VRSTKRLNDGETENHILLRHREAKSFRLARKQSQLTVATA
jgi:hypothetical protein